MNRRYELFYEKEEKDYYSESDDEDFKAFEKEDSIY